MRDEFHRTSEQEGLLTLEREELHERIARSELKSRGIDELLEELLREKERFTSVFQTERGSYYFVLTDGSCLRIQELDADVRDEDDGRWRARPIADHVLFVDPSSIEQLRQLRDYPGFVLTEGEATAASRTIVLTGVRIGAVPFEYGFSSVAQGIKPVFRIDGSLATYIGSEKDGSSIPLDSQKHMGDYTLGVTHIGHAISDILWLKPS